MQVDGQIFDVSRQELEAESSVIRKLLFEAKAEEPWEERLHGQSRATPLVLSAEGGDLSRHQFNMFLVTLYQPYVYSHPPSYPLNVFPSSDIMNESSKYDAIAVLQAASVLGAPRIQSLAEKRLDGIFSAVEVNDVRSTQIERLCIAQKYGSDVWLKDAYEAIVSRTDPIDADEAEKIGWSNALELCRIREVCAMRSITLSHEDRNGSNVVCTASRSSDLIFEQPGENFRNSEEPAFDDFTRELAAGLPASQGFDELGKLHRPPF